MNDELVRKVGERGIDNLIAHIFPAPQAMPVIVTGEGTLERGTLLGTKDGEKYAIMKEEEGLKASCILCDDTPIPTEKQEDGVPAAAYINGTFNKDAVKVKDEYELTFDDLDRLRSLGIFLVPQRQ